MQATVTCEELNEQIVVVEQALELMIQAAELLKSLNDRALDLYVLPALEGRAGGWLGSFARDELESYRDGLIERLDECDG